VTIATNAALIFVTESNDQRRRRHPKKANSLGGSCCHVGHLCPCPPRNGADGAPDLQKKSLSRAVSTCSGKRRNSSDLRHKDKTWKPPRNWLSKMRQPKSLRCRDLCKPCRDWCKPWCDTLLQCQQSQSQNWSWRWLLLLWFTPAQVPLQPHALCHGAFLLFTVTAVAWHLSVAPTSLSMLE